MPENAIASRREIIAAVVEPVRNGKASLSVELLNRLISEYGRYLNTDIV